MDTQEVLLEASPVVYKQSCPICHSTQDVKHDGRNKPRKIRHLSIFGRKSYLHVPTLRLACTRCRIGFVWTYDFVGPKQRYSRAFRIQTIEQALGSTVAHSAKMQEAPASMVQHASGCPSSRKQTLGGAGVA